MAANPLTVYCPHCGATWGQRCMTITDWARRKPHAARIKAAAALDAYQQTSNEIAELTGN